MQERQIARCGRIFTRAVALWLTLICAGGLYSLAQSPRTPEATRVVHFQASPNASDKGRQGYCWTTSIAAPFRGDAWRCMEESQVFDPCFQNVDGTAAVCGMNPARAEPGFLLTLTKPLPTRDQLRQVPPTESALLLQLSDFTYCTRFTGTRPFVGRSIATFACNSNPPGANVVLLDAPEPRRRLWVVRRAVLVEKPSGWAAKSIDYVPVETAWK